MWLTVTFLKGSSSRILRHPGLRGLLVSMSIAYHCWAQMQSAPCGMAAQCGTNPEASPQRLVGCLMRVGVNEACLDDVYSKEQCLIKLLVPSPLLRGSPIYFKWHQVETIPPQAKAVAVTSTSTVIELAWFHAPSQPPTP